MFTEFIANGLVVSLSLVGLILLVEIAFCDRRYRGPYL